MKNFKFKIISVFPCVLVLFFGMPALCSGERGDPPSCNDEGVVAHVNMAKEGEPFDKWYDAKKHGGGEKSFTWDGIATETRGFEQLDFDFLKDPALKKTCIRIMPGTETGKTVPPPYYRVHFKLWNHDKTVLQNSGSQRIYVKQVVQINWTQQALDLLMNDYYYKFGDGTKAKIYSKFTGTVEELKDIYTAKLSEYFEGVNIVFTTRQDLRDGYFTKKLKMDGQNDAKRKGTKWEFTYGTAPNNELNLYPDINYAQNNVKVFFSRIEYFYFLARMVENRSPSDLINNPIPGFPIDAEKMLSALAFSGAHEIGHNLGVNSSTYFHTYNDEENGHNPEEDPSKVMNNTPVYFTDEYFNIKKFDWTPLNKKYLKWLLPIPANNK